MPDIPNKILNTIENIAEKTLGKENYKKINEKLDSFWENESMKQVRKMVGGISIAFMNKLQEFTGQNINQNPTNSTNSNSNIPLQTAPAQNSQILPQTPPNSSQIPNITPQSLQNDEKVSLKSATNSNFSFGEIKDGAKIIIESNRKAENKIIQYETDQAKISRYTLVYSQKKGKNGEKIGKWKVESITGYQDGAINNDGAFVGISSIVKIQDGNLILPNLEVLKEPNLILNIQYTKPTPTSEEQAQITLENEQKNLLEIHNKEQKTFQTLTKGVKPEDATWLFPYNNENNPLRRVLCASDYLEVRTDMPGKKEEVDKAKVEKAKDLAEINKIFQNGQIVINFLKVETSESKFANLLALLNPNSTNSSTNSQNNQPNQPNQNPKSIYEEYLEQREYGQDNRFATKLATKIVRQIFPQNRFSTDLINPDLDLAKVGKAGISIISQLAAAFSKKNLNTAPIILNFNELNLDQLDLDRACFVGQNGKNISSIQTIEQMLAVASFEFFKSKIKLRMEEIEKEEITKKEGIKNLEKIAFLVRIRKIQDKIMDHKIKGEMTDEEFEQEKEDFKNKIEIKYTKDNANSNIKSKNITLGYLCSLLNLGGLSKITDENASGLGLNFDDQNEINAQNQILTKLENACDYLISLENTTKTLQELTQEFTQVQNKVKNEYPNLIEKIIENIKKENNKNGARLLLESITNEGKIENSKVESVKNSLAKMNIQEVEASKKWYELILKKLKEIETVFEAEKIKEVEKLAEQNAKLNLYTDILKELENLENSNESHFKKYKLVYQLGTEIKDKIWEKIKDIKEITSKSLTKEQIFDSKNTNKTYEIGLYYEVQKEMKQILEKEIIELKK